MPYNVIFWIQQVKDFHGLTEEEIIALSLQLGMSFGEELVNIEIQVFDNFVNDFITKFLTHHRA